MADLLLLDAVAHQVLVFEWTLPYIWGRSHSLIWYYWGVNYANLQFSSTGTQLRTGGIHHVNAGQLCSYLKLGAFADVAHSYEPTVLQKVRKTYDKKNIFLHEAQWDKRSQKALHSVRCKVIYHDFSPTTDLCYITVIWFIVNIKNIDKCRLILSLNVKKIQHPKKSDCGSTVTCLIFTVAWRRMTHQEWYWAPLIVKAHHQSLYDRTGAALCLPPLKIIWI